MKSITLKIFLTGLFIFLTTTFVFKTSDIGSIVNPLSDEQKTFDFNSLLPKLQEKKNTFSLKSMPENIVSSAYASDFDISAFAYIVLDFDSGEILAEKNSSQILPIASLTKVMTSVVALDLAAPEEIFTISQNAETKPATKIGVIPGQKMTVEELLNAVLLTSANDAAEAIKDGIDSKYHSKIFISAMNEKAKFLGLSNSSFNNVQGFDSIKNFSSSGDFAILSHYALTNYPLLSEIVKKDYEFLPQDHNHKQFDLYNWNGLLGVYPNISGIKIGNTDDALFTTAVVSGREGKKVLTVLLGAPGAIERDLWASALLDIGFEKLGLQKIAITEEQLLEKYSTWRYWH